MTSLSLTVLTIPSREVEGRALAKRLKAKVWVDESGDPTRAHADAWLNAAGSADDADSWVGVIEDDAVPAEGFSRPALEAMLNASPASVVSGYLGTGRPTNSQGLIGDALASDPHFVLSFQVLHHVAVFMRAGLAASAVEYLSSSSFPCDEALGIWAQRVGQPVAYCVPSLFDHEDGPSSIVPVGVERRAWRTGVREDWDGSSRVFLDRATRNRYGGRYE